MDEKDDLTRLASDMAFALSLLRASRALYGELLSAIEENVDQDGTANIAPLLARFNAALTAFAPRDREMARLAGRYES